MSLGWGCCVVVVWLGVVIEWLGGGGVIVVWIGGVVIAWWGCSEVMVFMK